ncbi:MAG: two-component sensor histidine kinase [Bacteroidetes bacterium]|nr:two-component sensor histidine kinase [Bacteroidota bacterium]
MFLLQTTIPAPVSVLVLGSIGILVLVVGVISAIVLHQRKILHFNKKIQEMEAAHQKNLLDASIKLQEEERQRLASDLHDDAGPLLATARLYLNENLINYEKSEQLQAILQTRGIIDETIMLVRNISHNLMPPTLKNFGLESAVTDMFQKISNSGAIKASSRFHNYSERLREDRELLIFRIIQELLNNILKHSKPSYINLNQTIHEGSLYIRIQHDGGGILQSDFYRLNRNVNGLGLKNITGRLKVLFGNINFERDITNTAFKVTIDVPINEPVVAVQEVSEEMLNKYYNRNK